MPETLTLDDKLKRLPRSPGVYLFKNALGEILYIGKAKVLRNRVRSYFQPSNRHDTKTRQLVARIMDLDWIVTNSEMDALIAEMDLVRHHQPRYNISLKDDKSFPFIKITREPFPQVFLTRQVREGSGTYLGPYTNVKQLRETLRVLHKIFPIRTCTYHITPESIRERRYKVCLDYHIHRCEGPCEGLVSGDRYRTMILQVEKFLHGDSADIVASLKAYMARAAEDLRYEAAARYRDQLTAVEHYARRQAVVAQDFSDRDLVAVDVASSYGVGVVLRVRQGRLIGKEKFDLTVGAESDVGGITFGFLKQYYRQTSFIPGEILIHEESDEKPALEAWLSTRAGRRVRLLYPRRGEKVRQLQMARRNATLMLNEIKLKKAKRQELMPQSVERLQEDLGLEVPPRRIEGFDNSNLQGSHPVSAMVCFVDGKPRKGGYRKYGVKTVVGADDFATMREIITRRYSRVLNEEGTLPDLVLVDGGKGQLSMARAALDELGLSYIPVIGLAKRLEEVYRPGHSEPFNIPRTSPGLTLLRRIRDESHRFAVTFHRQRRSKAMVRSVLDDIPGIGPARLKAIWKVYSSLEEIAESDSHQISRQTGLSSLLAEAVRSRAQQITVEN